jgi:hypothetical protein
VDEVREVGADIAREFGSESRVFKGSNCPPTVVTMHNSSLSFLWLVPLNCVSERFSATRLRFQVASTRRDNKPNLTHRFQHAHHLDAFETAKNNVGGFHRL